LRRRARRTVNVPARNDIPTTAKLGSTSGAGFGAGEHLGLDDAQGEGVALAATPAPNARTKVKIANFKKLLIFVASQSFSQISRFRIRQTAKSRLMIRSQKHIRTTTKAFY
jgi:hypothetical protein